MPGDPMTDASIVRLEDIRKTYQMGLVAVEALTPAEAATACGVAPEALRKRLSRARAMLAQALHTDELGRGKDGR